MLRSREELTKFFTDEVINHEIDRVKKADDGDVLFFMETWENEDFVLSILSYAEVLYHKLTKNGLRYYIKGK